ncbi:hypothetical protein Nepgr_023056 [Nepenthes gracilis]|uniref:Uncharacterized protein n=1 Tax=Nepenthes gracilis TaxID=150966 RepID=A0AAD3T279_NEPGR|nr:hypothetical protein Nepgr_023056 [Nepenthes gracilis]
MQVNLFCNSVPQFGWCCMPLHCDCIELSAGPLWCADDGMVGASVDVFVLKTGPVSCCCTCTNPGLSLASAAGLLSGYCGAELWDFSCCFDDAASVGRCILAISCCWHFGFAWNWQFILSSDESGVRLCSEAVSSGFSAALSLFYGFRLVNARSPGCGMLGYISSLREFRLSSNADRILGMPQMIHFSDDGEVGDAGGYRVCLLDCGSLLFLPVYLKWLLGVLPNLELELVACYYLEFVAEFLVLLACILDWMLEWPFFEGLGWNLLHTADKELLMIGCFLPGILCSTAHCLLILIACIEWWCILLTQLVLTAGCWCWHWPCSACFFAGFWSYFELVEAPNAGCGRQVLLLGFLAGAALPAGCYCIRDAVLLLAVLCCSCRRHGFFGMLGGGLAGAGGTMIPAYGSDTGMMQHPRWCAGRQLMSVSWLEAGLLLLKILLADESVDAELDDLHVDAGYPGSFW